MRGSKYCNKTKPMYLVAKSPSSKNHLCNIGLKKTDSCFFVLLWWGSSSLLHLVKRFYCLSSKFKWCCLPESIRQLWAHCIESSLIQHLGHWFITWIGRVTKTVFSPLSSFSDDSLTSRPTVTYRREWGGHVTSVKRCLHMNADSFDTDDVFFTEALWFVIQIVLTSNAWAVCCCMQIKSPCADQQRKYALAEP